MKRFLIVGLVATVLTGAASLAQARTDVVFSVDLGFPQPVYVQPRPVFVQPAPVYYQNAPVYYGRPHGHGQNCQLVQKPHFSAGHETLHK